MTWFCPIVHRTFETANAEFRDDGYDGGDGAGDVVAEDDGVGVARRQDGHQTVQTVLIHARGRVQDYH